MNSLLLLAAGAIAATAQESVRWEELAHQAAERSEAEDVQGAETLSRQALRMAELELGADHPQLIPLSTQFAGILHRQGRDAEAEPLLRHAVAMANAAGDPKLLGIALNALGNALHGEGQAARAEPVLRRSLALFEQSEGKDALDTAKAANNLGTLYSDTGQYERAEREISFALSFYEKHRGSFPALFTISLRNMFVILLAQRRMEEAESYLKRAEAIASSEFPESRKMAALRFDEAVLNARRGKFQEAADLLQQVVEMQERLLGSQHRELARSLMIYSEVLRRLHHRTEAQQLKKRGTLILQSSR
jgi:tetratricopeptide (TPR) repeat protein